MLFPPGATTTASSSFPRSYAGRSRRPPLPPKVLMLTVLIVWLVLCFPAGWLLGTWLGRRS